MALPTSIVKLDGWRLWWAEVAVDPSCTAASLDPLVARVEAQIRTELAGRALAEIEPCASVRRLFRAVGTDPTRYRPSAEALLRRVLRGEPLPRIQPLVDFNNLLSLLTRLPCCILRPTAVSSPVTLRAGVEGETMDSLRGPFPLVGKPLLADGAGPFGTPITDSHRVAIGELDRHALLVLYAPTSSAGSQIEAIEAVAQGLAASLAELTLGAHQWSSDTVPDE